MNELVHSRHSVGLSNYHMQFTTKYRRDVFRDRMVIKKCKESFKEVANKLGIIILALEFGPDHVHLFVGNCKNYSISQLARHFKGFSSKVIREECRDNIKRKLWGNKFWSNGFFTRLWAESQAKQHNFTLSDNRESIGWMLITIITRALKRKAKQHLLILSFQYDTLRALARSS